MVYNEIKGKFTLMFIKRSKARTNWIAINTQNYNKQLPKDKFFFTIFNIAHEWIDSFYDSVIPSDSVDKYPRN